MYTEIMIGLATGFLVFLILFRRVMLKAEVKPCENRLANRRQDKRRAHTGRRIHEFHANCTTKNKRKNEDRRNGCKDRRHRNRRHTSQAA